MAELDVGELVVVEERDGGARPIGSLTDRDLVVRGLARGGERVRELRVADLMRGDPITAREDEDVDGVLERMRRYSIRRMPIVDDAGHLQGMLTLDDIVAWKAAPPAAATREPQPRRFVERVRPSMARAFVGGIVSGLIGGALLGALCAAIGAPLTPNLWAPVLGVSAAWGALFGLLAGGLSRPVTVLVGALFGAVVGALLLFVVLPGVADLDVRAVLPVGTTLGLHVAFGVAVALVFCLFHEPRERVVELPPARSSSL